MKTEWLTYVGHMAAALSSIGYVPQVYKTWKSKHVKDLSFSMLVLIFLSTLFWLVYGIGAQLWPVILCNSLICALTLLLLYFKIKY